jgi:hypothetical protein
MSGLGGESYFAPTMEWRLWRILRFFPRRPGYQTLINQVLRAWYEAQIKRARLTLPAKLAAKKHKIALSAEERREAASWKKVYAAAAKRKAKKAAAKAAARAKKRA